MICDWDSVNGTLKYWNNSLGLDQGWNYQTKQRWLENTVSDLAITEGRSWLQAWAQECTTWFWISSLLSDCVILGIGLHDLQSWTFWCLSSLSYKAGVITAPICGRSIVMCHSHCFLSLLGTKGKHISHSLFLSLWGPVTSSDHWNVSRSCSDTTGLTPETSHKIVHALSPLSVCWPVAEDPEDSEAPNTLLPPRIMM